MDVQERIAAALARGVAGGLPGVVGAARLADGSVVQATAGVRGLDNPSPMTPDTVFWIASFTKAVTTAAVLQLVEQGLLGLDDPAGRWLPGLARPKVLTGFDAQGKPLLVEATAPVTVRHLLAHTSGLAYDFCNAAFARWRAHVAEIGVAIDPARGDAPLVFQPGAGWTYGVGLDWAGELVAAVSGRTLDVYLKGEVFGPLAMTSTGWAPSPDRQASMHARGDGGALAPMPFGLPPAPNGAMGGGGLYSTAADYLTFLGAILDGGGPILSPASVALMRTGDQWEGEEVGVLPAANPRLCAGFDPFPGRKKRWSLGFVVNPEPGPAGRSAGSLAWAGLGNCYYWADPEKGIAGVFLAQLLPFGDAAALEAFGDFERAVYDL